VLLHENWKQNYSLILHCAFENVILFVCPRYFVKIVSLHYICNALSIYHQMRLVNLKILQIVYDAPVQKKHMYRWEWLCCKETLVYFSHIFVWTLFSCTPSSTATIENSDKNLKTVIKVSGKNLCKNRWLCLNLISITKKYRTPIAVMWKVW